MPRIMKMTLYPSVLRRISQISFEENRNLNMEKLKLE